MLELEDRREDGRREKREEYKVADVDRDEGVQLAVIGSRRGQWSRTCYAGCWGGLRREKQGQ
jgi:hypothetical protein